MGLLPLLLYVFGPGEVDAWRPGRHKGCSYSVSIHLFLQQYSTPLNLASKDCAVVIGCR